MADSILTNIKKIVGITELDTSFDPDIIMHTNAVFGVLNQLGIGPTDGFMIEDSTSTWDDFISDNKKLLSLVKSYAYLRVKLLFDSNSATSFLLDSMQKQIQELEVRMSIVREGDSWVDPMPTVISSTTWWD